MTAQSRFMSKKFIFIGILPMHVMLITNGVSLVDSQPDGYRVELAKIISYRTSASGMIFILFKTLPKYKMGNQNKNINDPKKSPHAYDICRPMMAKPMKPLELHYPVIRTL